MQKFIVLTAFKLNSMKKTQGGKLGILSNDSTNVASKETKDKMGYIENHSLFLNNRRTVYPSFSSVIEETMDSMRMEFVKY